MNRLYFLLTLSLAALPLAPAVTSADVVTDWSATFRSVMQQNGTLPVHKANPGWSTRSAAMLHGAIYDAFQAVEPTHFPFLVNTQAVPGTSLDAAVHQAAYEILAECYPAEQSMLTTAYNQRMGMITDGTSKTDGIALGHSIALAYMANRANDHANDTVQYMPGVGPGLWRPDPYNLGQSAWGPGWGTVNTFAIPNTADFVDDLPPPPALSTPAYTAAFNQVKDYGALVSPSRNSDQTAIGLFWAYDRPSMGPPGVLFARNLEEIAEAVGNSPAENARLFAMASVAEADAATAAWDAKFQYNYWRPVQGIQEAGTGGPGDADGNPDTVADPTWRPLGAPGNVHADMVDDFTPPFPSWTSGHATMGAAVYKSLELFYGTNSFSQADSQIGNDSDETNYTLNSDEAGSGSSRTYVRFTQEGPFDLGYEDSPEGENAMSRIYLGVHWMFDQVDGTTLGHNIANYVAANHFQPIPEPSTMALVAIPLAVLAARRVLRRRR
jgi:hypothetical protein